VSGSGSDRPYWALRIAETGLLLTSFAGIALFAYSLVDILRIETDSVAAGSVPPLAWPGIFVFFGSMIALQVVRTVLHRYRGDDGAPRGARHDDATDA